MWKMTYVCRDHDGKVTPEEVAAAAIYLKDTLGKEGVQELISSLSKDRGQLIFFFCWYAFTLFVQINKKAGIYF